GAHRKIFPVARAREAARFPDERPGDDPSQSVAAHGEIESDAVDAVCAVDRNPALVCGDLEHAVRRRVYDRLPGGDMFGSEVVDDPRPRCRIVSERPAPDFLFELGDQRFWKAVWKDGKCTVEEDP